MRVFKSKHFDRWAQKQKLHDKSLLQAIAEMKSGLFDATLGGHLYKKRIATEGRGKSGSTRTIIAFKKGQRAFLIYGFDKGTRANITKKEKEALKIYGGTLLGWPDSEIQKRIDAGELLEIMEVQ